MRPYVLVLLPWLCVLPGCGRAPAPRTETPEITISADPLDAAPGEVIGITLRISHPRELAPALDAACGLPDNLVVVEGPVENNSPLPGGWARTEFTWKVTGYVPGPLSVPPVGVKLGDSVLKSTSLSISITDPLKDKVADIDALHGEKPPLDVPLASTRLLVLLSAGAVILLVAAAIVLFAWVLKRKRRAATSRVLLPTPYETALAALEALRENIPLITEFKPMYYEMNMVLRRFIEDVFDFAASRSTTEEFLEDALVQLPEELREGLEEYFHACDLVKYAGLPVDRNAAAAALGTAEEFVRRTERIRGPIVVGEATGGAA
ncbi:MAG: hypothetical protein JW909_11335 [Planctomycetes bacterium]|nr:hypothetical protein [Planctomycetota bacterium]